MKKSVHTNIVNMSILPKLIRRFNSIPLKFQKDFLTINKITFTFIWK